MCARLALCVRPHSVLLGPATHTAKAPWAPQTWLFFFFFPSKETSFHKGIKFLKDLDTVYIFLLIFTNQNLNYSAQVSKEYLDNKVFINMLLLSYYMRLNRGLPCSSQAPKIQILFQKCLPFPRQPRDALWPPGDPHVAQSPQMHVVQSS